MKNLILILFVLISSPLFAQQEMYRWRIGVYGGDMAYFGDLNRRFFAPNPLFTKGDTDYLSYGASIESILSNAWSVKILYSQGRFETNDIAYDWKNKILPNESNFGRALNARTNIRDVSLMMTYYLDNDRISSKRAFLAPYFSFGIGMTDFEVFGDLLDKNGERYYYWSDKTIRNLPEGNPAGQIVEQDAKYETNLTDLQTEGEKYPTQVLNIPLSIGFKFRLNDRFNANLDFMMRYVFSDYLDDVSGKYLTNYNSELHQLAGNPTNNSAIYRGKEDDKWNDFYTFTSLSLHYNFGKKVPIFQSPKIFASPLDNPNLDKSWILPEKSKEQQAIIENQTPKIQIKDTLNQLIAKVEKLESKKEKKKNKKKQKNQILATDSTLVKQKIITQQKDSVLIQNNQIVQIKKDSTIIQKTVVTQIDSINQFNINPFNPLYDGTKPITQTENKTTVESQNELQKLENDIKALELQVKKKSLENDLNMMEAIGKTQTQAIQNNQNPNDLNQKNDPTTFTQAQNYILQEKIKLEKERQAFYEEQLKKNQNTSNLLRNQTENPANNTFSNNPYQPNLGLNFNVPLNPSVQKDTVKIYQIQENNIADSTKTKQLDTLNQKFDALMNQMTKDQTTKDSTNKSNAKAQTLAELENMKVLINQLQTQINQSKKETPKEEPIKPKASNFTGLGKYEIFFGSGVSQVGVLDKQKLKQFIDKNSVQNKANLTFVVRGFTDKVGNPTQNLELSKLRAAQVKALLLENGVLENQIVTEFYGVNYIGANYNPNYERRVEVVILGK